MSSELKPSPVSEVRRRIGEVAEVLLGYCESHQTFQTDRILTVPPGQYTEPDQWRAERDPPKDEADRERIKEELEAFRLGTEIALHDEDFATGLATQRGLDSGAHDGLMYGRNEAGSHHLHAWLNWYLRADPNSPKPAF